MPSKKPQRVYDSGKIFAAYKQIMGYAYAEKGLDYPTIVSKIADKTGEPKPVDPKIEKLIKTILSQEIKGKRLKKDGLLYIPRKQ